MTLPDGLEHAQELLPQLTLSRLHAEQPAGLWICSLPVPPGAPASLTLDDHATYVKPLGQWPGVDETAPRRLLLVADGQDTAPDELGLGTAQPASTHQPPDARMVLVEQSDDPRFHWECHALQLDWQGRQLELRLGLRTAGETHWWEACGLEEEESTPFCRVVHMSGAIPRQLTTPEMLEAEPGYNFPLLHKHNWLTGHLRVRLYANGVCEIVARHINGQYVDDGQDLADVVPVIGIRCQDPGELPGPWDGSRHQFELDGIPYEVSEVAQLASPDRPGQIWHEDDWLTWQPYQGVEVYSGRCAEERLGRPWIWLAEERTFPRGMTRSLRFSLSLGDRSPRIARYQAPFWWYGLTAEIQHETWLPVANIWNDHIYQSQRAWLHAHIVKNGFEAGAIPRGGPMPKPPGDARYEAGWEGDAPHGMLMLAWMTGDGADHDHALRNIYHFTDICIDHAQDLVRMHGYPPPAFAQPGHRVIGSIMGYLETGDPYLLNAAEAVVERAWRIHSSAWPRLAIGRDACFIRGAVLLYRYFANHHFRAIAERACHHVAHSQRPDGSFGDQGGGAGIHGWGGYIVKPWMAMLASMPLLDYLELFPDSPQIRDCIHRTGDWLMRQRFLHEDGHTGWSYQHAYRDGHDFYNFASREWTSLPGTTKVWHMDNLGRLLAWCSLDTGDGAFLDAWDENAGGLHEAWGDHSIAASLLSLPRIQTWLWKPRWTGADVALDPFQDSSRMPTSGTVLSPAGEVRVTIDDG